MHSSIRRGVTVGAAIGGVLAGGAGAALASTGATAESADSPGVVSGNTVQVPISVPINVCGDSVNVLGLLNLGGGAHCANGATAGAAGGSSHGTPGATGSHRSATGGSHAAPHGSSQGPNSTATGSSHGSPGVGSGNTVQVPISVPVNVCGVTVNVLSLGDGAAGADCANGATPPATSTPAPAPTPKPVPRPAPAPRPAPKHALRPAHARPRQTPATVGMVRTAATGELAKTGAEGTVLAPVAGALLLGGGLLLRRGRHRATRG